MADATLLIVPLAPLAAALFLTVWGLVSPRGEGRLPGTLTVVTTAGSLAALLAFAGRDAAAGVSWLETGRFSLGIGLEATQLPWFFAILVAGVSLVIAVYSNGYMARESGQARYFAELSLFIAGMLTLVLADSLVLLFAAWEIVGLSSFLLIGFHFREGAARRASLKAFVVTRFGDLGFLAAWLLLLQSTGSVQIGRVLASVEDGGVGGARLTAVALLLLLAAAGKSAQLPLTQWLPEAMAGPTPVSALIHSATMVAAGVYLVLRLFPVFQAAPAALDVMIGLGLATALVAALVATIQVDLKRVLAWSTVSQLGEMVLALGLGAPLAAAYHLTAHATFKASLFLTAGSVDKATGTRDLRHLGGLRAGLPFTAGAMLISALALAGVPPFAGFWSEDHILGAAVHRGWWMGAALLLVLLLAGFYIGRAVSAVLLRWPGSPSPEAVRPPRLMQVSTGILTLAAATSGLVLAVWGTGLLPFDPEAQGAVGWRIAAVLCGFAGLAAGWAVVRARGPVAPLAPVAARLERGVELAVVLPGRAALLAAGGVKVVEGYLDTAVRRLGTAAAFVARGVDLAEGGIDAAARVAAVAALAAASGVDVAERDGFAAGGRRLAASLAGAGALGRRAQTGRVYLYTLALFVWVGVAGLLSLFWWR